MRVFLLLIFGAKALVAINTTSTDRNLSSETAGDENCLRGECSPILNCLSNRGEIQYSPTCTCPNVYCCYSITSSSTSATTSSGPLNLHSSTPSITSSSTAATTSSGLLNLLSSIPSVEETPTYTTTARSSSTSQKSTVTTTTTEGTTEFLSTSRKPLETTYPSPSSQETASKSTTSETNASETTLSKTNTSISPAKSTPIVDDKMTDCEVWACLLIDQCKESGGNETVDSDNCPKPYTKCCFLDYE